MNAPLMTLTTQTRPRLDDLLRERVRLSAAVTVRWLRSQWQTDGEPAQAMAIPHADIDRALSPLQDRPTRREAFLASDPEARRLHGLAEAAGDALAADPDWAGLIADFALTTEEADLLNLCLAVELAPDLRRVCGYIHDDAAACYPSCWLAGELFAWPLRRDIAPASALTRWQLAQPSSNLAWSVWGAWAAEPDMVAWARGHRLVPDGALRCAASVACLYPAERETLHALLGGPSPDNPYTDCFAIAEIVGPEGSGRRTLATQACMALGRPLLEIDGIISAEPEGQARLVRALRTARLYGAVPCWRLADPPSPALWDIATRLASALIVCTETPMTFPAGASQSAHRMVLHRRTTLPALTADALRIVWQGLSDAPAPDVIGRWRLLPGDLVRAARAVPDGEAAVLAACGGDHRLGASELFVRLPCPYDWDDIVLPGQVRDHLREFEQQARLRAEVYDDWGFSRLCPLGRGITALFAGPSGTGKTMAAQVLARSLGLDLYRVDLAGVVNKYIGETEKRLRDIFAIAERGNVLIFFDEADALFGQRSEVKEANDRFANIEIDYLLQRMEQFDGVAVLATNRKNDLDSAFLRRLRHVVDFMHPGEAERLRIWQRVLPPRNLQGEVLLADLDHAALAAKLSLTGAEITLAALNAAFLARAEGERISMRHVLHAVAREHAKQGIILRQTEWRDA